MQATVSVLLVVTTNAVSIQEQENVSLGCPNFQLRCPTCEKGQKCVYPNSGGCIDAGIPACQATKCPNTVCLVQRIPCPKECPFNCRYSGSPCCPFQGKPECAPVCNTFVACHVTPCPDSCPGDCYYPNADYCCPKSGKAVCNKLPKPLISRSTSPEVSRSEILIKFQNQKKSGGIGYKSGGIPNVNWGFDYTVEAKTWDSTPTPSEEQLGWGYDVHGNYFDCDPNDKDCLFGNHNDKYNGNKKQGMAYGNQNNHEEHYHDDDDYYQGLFIGGLVDTHEHECSTCTKTVTDVDISLKFVTTTATVGDIVCAQYIIPCVFDYYKKKVKTLMVTEGYPFPYFPTNDPFHDIFTSMLNQSGITATTTFATDVSAETPISACPLIFRYCPIECPDSCLRPDVPCPFAAEGYCPGNSPTTTIPESALITPTAETVVGGDLICPLYMLACPICPKGYTCKRSTTGHCANTNVPYCVSTKMPGATPSITRPYPTPSASLIFFQPPPLGNGRPGGYNKLMRAQNDLPSTEDTCAKAGLTKVLSKEIFEQLQERHDDCEGCPFLEWDEFCPNTCIYRTEKDCCIESMCLPN
ncbi:hypothetical protein INT48_009141 [Thamnidium elegans]|uniref:Uncharacterized protein n=1 Tax=Thamnidium elegans TaxID=101142 RepID=A0A8H7SWJ8_9FUNG|nr:hypothetical protein INT48_009141 [Thamnidium elegans]